MIFKPAFFEIRLEKAEKEDIFEYKSQWRADLKMIFRAVAQCNLSQLSSAVTAESALWANAGKHFKAAGRTFEIGSTDLLKGNVYV